MSALSLEGANYPQLHELRLEPMMYMVTSRTIDEHFWRDRNIAAIWMPVFYVLPHVLLALPVDNVIKTAGSLSARHSEREFDASHPLRLARVSRGRTGQWKRHRGRLYDW
jgi:hypothetical protein